MTRRASVLSALLLLLGLYAVPGLGISPARATEFDFLPVGDPLESELRILDLLDPAGAAPARLRRLHSRPLQVWELPSDSAQVSEAGRLSLLRIGRWRARDLPREGSPPGTTPRLFQIEPEPGTGFEVSAAIEGAGEAD
jgi:hypothetical protein